MWRHPKNKLFLHEAHSNCECTCFLFWPVFSGLQMGPGRRSRTTSESSTHSGGRERSNSAVKQASPPPPSIPEQPRKEEAKKVKKDSPKKVHTHTLAWRCSVGAPAVFTSGQRNIPSFTQGGGGGGGGWLKSWLWKGKNEAHLPDDKNKSVSSCWLYSYGFCLCTYVLKMVNIDKSAMFFIARLCGMSRSRNGSTWTSLKRRSVAWNFFPGFSCLNRAAERFIDEPVLTWSFFLWSVRVSPLLRLPHASPQCPTCRALEGTLDPQVAVLPVSMCTPGRQVRWRFGFWLHKQKKSSRRHDI